MAGDGGELVIEVKLDDGSYRKAWVNLEKDSKEAGKHAGDGLSEGVTEGFNHVLKEIAAIGVAYLGLHAIFERVKEGIQGAIASEDAFHQLSLSLASTGHYSEEAAAHLHEYIEGLERTTAVSDTVIASGASLLASLGRLSGEGLDRATKSALDLAAGLHKGPEEAFQMLAKAAEGNINQFNRLGIHIAATGNKAVDFAQIMDAVNARFGGLAEGRLNTFGGAIERLKTTFEVFLKTIGSSFTHSDIILGVVKSIGDAFNGLSDKLKAMGSGGNLVDGIIMKMLELASTVVQYVIPPFELLYNIGETVFQAIKVGIQSVIVVLATLAADGASILAMFSHKYDGLKQTTADFAASTEQVWTDMAASMNKSAEGLFDFSATEKMQRQIDEYKAAAKRLVQAHKDTTTEINNADQSMPQISFWERMRLEFKAFASDSDTLQKHMAEFAKGMAKTMMTGLAGSLTAGFAAAGKAWQNGINVWDAMGKAMLGAFGGLLVQLGEQMMMAGLGMLLTGFMAAQGLAWMAGGAAVATAGGVLQAVGQGGGAGAAGGGLGAGGGVAASTAPGGFAQQTTAAAPPKPQTQLVVNIQGHVLDRQSTGLAIADILRENFELHGVTFAGAAAT